MKTPIERLVSFFGTQEKTAEALGVRQSSVHGWLKGKHGISEFHAMRAEERTGGAITAIELCPKLATIAA
ncbi:hypothetical protein LMG33818_000916 [Halomonadaceae bacterium LMG 33818]|uniref:transcriptional regulator n=1 Tax=Cernens ardua TaxID=3402176 RepID=UPI003EDB8061